MESFLIDMSDKIFNYYLLKDGLSQLDAAKKTGKDLYQIIHDNVSKNNEMTEEEINEYCENLLKSCFRIQSLK